MVCTLVDVLPTKHYLASYSHADFAPHGNMTPEELFAGIAANGVTQHYGIAPGDVTAELEALAKCSGLTLQRSEVAAMKKILLITYDNCDDSEVLYPLFRMREAGYTVDVASMESVR